MNIDSALDTAPATGKTGPAEDLAAIHALVHDELRQVEARIGSNLDSEIVLIRQLADHLIGSGGKRLRPTLLLLSARLFGYSDEQHVSLAAIVEFIHTATLLHDDVVDASLLRRGQVTANQRWGNQTSVLVGDFLYSRAFQMMVQIDSMRVMRILADTTNRIAEGEVRQLLHCHETDVTQEQYLHIVRGKTATLFEAAARLGAVLCKRPMREEESLARYGMHLGTAYQLIDDILDYDASITATGKRLGGDLAEGKATLPLLYALWHSSGNRARQIREAIHRGGRDGIDAIAQTIEATGAIAYTKRLAQAETERAIACLEGLPSGEYLDGLRTAARFVVERNF